MILPRYSLRLLLVAVAVLCACLARERNLVFERRAALAKFADDPSFFSLTVEERDELAARMGFHCVDIVSIPIWRQWMGDAPVQTISYLPNADAESIQMAHRLFPEAIHVGPRGTGPQRRSP